MAKKQTMNLLEAHFEKMVIALAALFLLWVLYANVINAPGVDVNGQKLSGVEAAEKASQLANDAVASMARPAPLEELVAYQPVGDLLEQVKPLAMNEIPLTPPDYRRTMMEQDVRDYTIPSLPELREPKMVLTQAMATVPASTGPDDQLQPAIDASPEVKDVIFVSVEATVDMESLYTSFETAFTGPQVKKKLTENYLPVVAAVELLRSELLDDGSWAEPVSVPRCNVDPMKNSLSAVEVQGISKARQSVAMKDNSTDQVQLMLVQPATYDLVTGPWRNPSAPADATQPGAAGGRPMADPRAGAAADPRAGGRVADPRAGGMGMGVAVNSTLKDKELKIWAHDDSATPGKVYKYSIRLGIFNPCFETNWLNKSQSDLKYKPVLWTTAVSINNQVQIPPIALFVPRAISEDGQSARVEVYKFQYGQWFKRAFTVKAGDTIGSVVELDALDVTASAQPTAARAARGGRGGAAETEQPSSLKKISVDFSINATVLAITAPEAREYELNGQKRTEMTGEIIYKDSEGQRKTLTTHNAFWTQQYRDMVANVNRAFTADDRKRRDAAR